MVKVVVPVEPVLQREVGEDVVGLGQEYLPHRVPQGGLVAGPRRRSVAGTDEGGGGCAGDPEGAWRRRRTEEEGDGAVAGGGGSSGGGEAEKWKGHVGKWKMKVFLFGTWV